jgi:uncharacterized membrane protein YgdD (TMEM256/DUF423 family)
MERKLIITGLIFILLGIVLGAMGAHYIETLGATADQVDSFGTGTSYLFYNGTALLALTALIKDFDFGVRTQFNGILFGTILFSGSIFALVFLPLAGIEFGSFIGPVTPIGGLLMIFGWFTLIVKYLRAYPK